MSEKIAVFDFDWTIVRPKSDSTFPKNVDDWQWYKPSVPSTIEQYISEDYIIIFWTNQSKTWKNDMIRNVASTFSIHPKLVICTKKSIYKPNRDYFIREINDMSFDTTESFMVGDALGRDGDHSDVDFLGSIELGIDCYSPEDIFFEDEIDISIDSYEGIEVIIMCGYPGSGKSTIANTFPNYHICSGDILKTPKKMLKDGEKWINTKSVIFDATNMTREKRSIYVNFAHDNDVHIRCIWLDITAQESITRNIARLQKGGKRVPNIAIYKLRKTFEEPTECEGFDLHRIKY